MDYEKHLLENDYSKTTIEHYLKRLDEFQTWLKKRRTKATDIDYKTNLKYIQYLRRKGMKVQTINNNIVTLRNYFGYLMAIGLRTDNPLEDVSVK